MASVAVIEDVHRKISAAFEKREDAENEINTMLETLMEFKTHVEWLQDKADLGRETSEETEWRKRVVRLACLVEDFVDLSTHRHEFSTVGRNNKLYIRKLDRRMEKKLDELHGEIDYLRQHQPQPLYDTSAAAPESSGSPADGYDPCLHLPAAEAELIGVGSTREKLASLLVDGEKHQKVVSIVGFAGLGKTTLAMKIYRQTEGKFECHATASVSRKPDMKRLLQHLLLQLRPEAPRSMELELQQLIEEIREHLQDKRYLILLDDMWERSAEVERALPDNNCGSRIIVTTRVKRLSYLGPRGCEGAVLEMERPGAAESESLLSKEIYELLSNGNYENWYLDDWEQHLHKTAQTYDGVPLTMVAIAGLEKERLAWGYYTAGMMQELEQARNRILLSYIDLNPCLKARMMLLCMFPCNFGIESEILIRIWKAEGYAARAEHILEELIDRNVILPARHEDMDEVEAWKVYFDMFNEILLRSAEDDFLITSSSLKLLRTTKMVRRLALHRRNERTIQRLQKLDLGFISSLSIFGNADRIDLDKFGNLRVLDIQGWEHLKDDDLYHICDMVLLRYLSLRFTPIRNIPPKIINLRYLETLDLRKTRVTVLPSQVGQLPKLTDLLVGTDPSSRVKIPTGFRHFESLQTLEIIHLTDAWLLLNSLPHLKEIGIMCPFPEYSYSQGKLWQPLKNSHGLQSLTFYGVICCSMEFLNDAMSCIPPSIRKFRVTGKLVNIPRWIATLKNLTLLKIKVCHLSPGDLQTLGELPRLQRLLLGLDLLPEQEMVITAGFLELEKFSFDCRVPWVAFQLGAMPKLTELELKFREGPANKDTSPSGIYHLLSLKRVSIYYSSWCQDSPVVKATVRAMVAAVSEHRNPVKLVVNGNMDAQAFT